MDDKQNEQNQTWEMESLNGEDIAIDTLDERVEFSTIRALWACTCDGGHNAPCGYNVGCYVHLSIIPGE